AQLPESCQLKTLTKALALVGASPPPGTRIVLFGIDTFSAGETMPFVVPVNTTIEANGATVKPPGNGTAFILSKPDSGLDGPFVDGNNRTARNGLVVLAGST